MRFSIIIPAYQAEHTLEKCLASIRMQNFQNYEVLIINDGSTDATSKAAQQTVASDSRFHLISTAHQGPGAARNEGLVLARGEYILHMDADDYWIREDLLSELDSQIQLHPADIYLYQMVKLSQSGQVLHRYDKPPFSNEKKVLDLKDVYQDLVADGQALAAACNKCVNRDFLLHHQIRFRDQIFAEDIDWVLQLFSHVQTICLLNIQAYGYVQYRIPTRSNQRQAPNDLASIVLEWGERAIQGTVAHHEAVAGLAAFEYAICMGSHHLMQPQIKRLMRRNAHLLHHGLDRKTQMICRFYRIFGYHITCLAIRIYLLLRRIW